MILGPAALGGLLMGLTPAPFSLWPLAWIAMVPLWLTVMNPACSIRLGLLAGAVWGGAYHGLALFWITGVHPMTWLGVSWWSSLAIALICWLVITAWGAVLVMVWAGLCRCLYGQTTALWPQIWGGIALWCTLEWLWSFTPLYWSTLAYTQSPGNLIILHLGQLGGPLLVTATLVAVNGLMAATYSAWQQASTRGFSYRLAILTLFLLAGPHLLGLGLYRQPLQQAPDQALKVGIIQGNIPNEIKLNSQGFRQALEGYTRGYRTLANLGVDAVFTPETALPFLWTAGDRQISSFYQAIRQQGVVAWVGSLGTHPGGDRSRPSLTNSLFTITGDGEIFSRYDKVNLVPLGEYIPFASLVGDWLDRLSPLDAHLVAGSRDQVFETPFGRAIVGICYDSPFPEHFRRQAAAGGQWILSASNDAHYSAAMPAQHHAQDVMRAIEGDRWALRATNTGYSAVVDPHGRTLWLSDLNTYDLHVATIYRHETLTPYVRSGNWLLPFLWGLTVWGWWRTRGC